MIRSSFASFNTAKMAIMANQSALAIVGQNMANVKTPGYTRQRLDQISLNSTGFTSTTLSRPEAHIGYGVMVTGVSQIRDPFLDTRYRLEMGNLGSYDQKAEILERLGIVFDETGRTGLDDQFTDLIDQLQAMNNNATSSGEGMVRSSAQTLCGILNNYAKGLSDTEDYVKQGLEKDVKDINDILKQIQDLNVSIKNGQVHGNPALELQDQRNLLIDSLATYGDIRVSHSTNITITGNNVDYMTIDYVTADGTKLRLIDDANPPGSMALQEKNGKTYLQVTDTKGDSVPSAADFAGADESKYTAGISSKGTMQSAFSMLNNAGEFDKAGVPKGIPYYRKVLDEIARSFADIMNKLNNVNKADGTPNDGSGDLFQTNDGTADINAANISISAGWLDGTVNLQKNQKPDEPLDKDATNILNMINALNNKQTFQTDPTDPTSTKFFTGTFQECFNNMINIQSMDQKSTNSTLDNYLSIVNEIANAKESVSGVNLDEEAMNMMQYNSALTAASRYMTTLDEALNTIISNMGVVGR